MAAAASQMASRARVELRAIEQEQAANEQQAQKAKAAAAKDLEAAKSADKNELKQSSNEDRKKNKGDTEDINTNTLETGSSASKLTDAAQTSVERPKSLGALQALIVYQRISRMADIAGAQKI